MATPRKFSEKIAILQRKERAEQDEFQNVMSEVQQITGSGVSPQTTPSGTPFACSPTNGPPGRMPGGSSVVTTPSAESPMSGLLGDTLMPMHPLAGMPPYSRPGGSLPNVHQMVQQNPHHAMLNQFAQHQHNPAAAAAAMAGNPWYWHAGGGQMPSASGAGAGVVPQTHVRTRSPGSATHYHPYAGKSPSTGSHRTERTSTFDQQMMDNRLQLPENYQRARSDPAIHMNATNPCYYNQPFAQPFNQQQQQFYQQPQPNWAHVNGSMMPGAGMPAQPPPQTPYYGGGVPASTAANSQTAPSSAGSSASSVPMSMNSPQQSTANGGGGMGGYMKQSPCGSPDMSVVGSLPNMHSSMVGQQSMMNHHQQSPQHQQSPMQQQPPSYYDYDPQGSGQQPQQTSPPQLHSAPPVMNVKQEPGAYYHHNGGFAPNGYQQLSTPQGCGQESSQSAPTSPAVGYEHKQPQWPPNPPMNRHYSASPDNTPIPNIVFTDADGRADYPQDLHNDIERMRFEEDIQELIHSETTNEISAECEAAILR
ncbi:TORC-N domain-containing protein [Aphelenchoides fujianensis]|nr:TORC-N domain-containing protein [Aphelenchoides fujianensis]